MLPLILAIITQAAAPVAIVIGFDSRPVVIVATGYGTNLTPIKPAAERCGFSRTWIFDDNTDQGEFWVLAEEASYRRTDCLNRWRHSHPSSEVKWKLTQTR